jgi:hypothetical protein
MSVYQKSAFHQFIHKGDLHSVFEPGFKGLIHDLADGDGREREIGLTVYCIAATGKDETTKSGE